MIKIIKNLIDNFFYKFRKFCKEFKSHYTIYKIIFICVFVVFIFLVTDYWYDNLILPLSKNELIFSLAGIFIALATFYTNSALSEKKPIKEQHIRYTTLFFLAGFFNLLYLGFFSIGFGYLLDIFSIHKILISMSLVGLIGYSFWSIVQLNTIISAC